jgi:hypothetical protein
MGELEERNRSLVARIADLEERLGRNPRNSSMPTSSASSGARSSSSHRCGPSSPSTAWNADGVRAGARPRPLHPKRPPPRPATAPGCAPWPPIWPSTSTCLMTAWPGSSVTSWASRSPSGPSPKWWPRSGGALGLFTEVIRDLLIAAPAVNFDETGARVAGSLHWIHVACNALYTLIDCHKWRGRVAMDAMGVIEAIRGTRSARWLAVLSHLRRSPPIVQWAPYP